MTLDANQILALAPDPASARAGSQLAAPRNWSNLGGSDAAQGELLDKNGQVLPVPVQSTTRSDGDALKWASAEAALAPLAPGDYAIRATITRGSKTDQVVTAFRIVP